jgi:hypothetical protein
MAENTRAFICNEYNFLIIYIEYIRWLQMENLYYFFSLGKEK